MESIKVNPGIVHALLSLPSKSAWIDYDEEADVLYISLIKPQNADDSILEDDGNIYHYKNDNLVGITIMNAKRSITNN